MADKEIVISDKVYFVFIDGTGGGREAAENKLLNVSIRRDLEHIKRNLRERRGKKW